MKTIIRQTTCIGALAASLLGAASASAEVKSGLGTQAYCIPAGTTQTGGFKDSDSTKNGGTLSFNGSPKVLANGSLLLTEEAQQASQNAQVYYKDPLDFSYSDSATQTTRPFHTFFSFTIGPNAAPTAGSGFSFIVQNNSATKVGSNEDGLGYAGIKTSFEIEFDTYKDDPPIGTSSLPDPSGDHIGFMLDGEQYQHAGLFKPGMSFSGPSYTTYYVWLDYKGKGSKKLELYFSADKKKPTKPVEWALPSPVGEQSPDNLDPDYWLSIHMANPPKPPQGWAGFTASTYDKDRDNDHIIHEWEFSNTGDIPCACQGATACGAETTTPACSAGPGTQNKGICVECTPTAGGDSLCKAGGKVCDTGGSETCVDCNVNADCPSKTPVCDATKHTCDVCTTDADCKGHPETPVCALTGTQKGACVECNQKTDCKSDKPLCNATTNACVECTTTAECNATNPVCDTTKGTCDPCTKDDDCKAYTDTPVCVLKGDKAGACGSAAKCDSSHPCPSGTVCDSSSNMCVACTQGVDCEADGTDIIDGGGFSCSILGGSDKGPISGLLLGALGLAGAVARRRARRSA